MSTDWTPLVIPLSSLCGALGSFLGLQIRNARQRKVIDHVWEEKEARLVLRLAALEARVWGHVRAGDYPKDPP